MEFDTFCHSMIIKSLLSVPDFDEEIYDKLSYEQDIDSIVNYELHVIKKLKIDLKDTSLYPINDNKKEKARLKYIFEVFDD